MGDGAVGKGDVYKGYRIHGDSVDSLRAGFDAIAMPENRRGEALAIVGEIFDANDVREFRWYMTEGKPELCCYWDDLVMNALWITASNVHMLADAPAVRRPPRATTWEDEKSFCVGWTLPGADRTAGGGRHGPKAANVRCPATFLWQPVGTVCPDCEVVHSE